MTPPPVPLLKAIGPKGQWTGGGVTPRALIFDFDGVLVNTEPLHCKAWQEVLHTFGISFSKEEYDQKYIGLRDKEFIQKIFSEKGKTFSEDFSFSCFTEKEKIVKNLFLKEIPLIPGANSLLHFVSQKYPLALVTGSQMETVHFVLKKLHWFSFFTAIIAAIDVSHGKPNPEGFLKAFEKLSLLKKWEPPLQKSECLIFEDSQPGIQAAKSAGIPYIKVEGSLENLQNHF